MPKQKSKPVVEESNSIAIRTKMGFDIVKSTNIIRCEASRAYCTFYLVDGERITVSKSLSFFEAKLLEWNFYRVHKSNLVNIHHIEKYNREKSSLVLSDNSEVILSHRKKRELIERLTFSSVSPKQHSRIAV